MDSFVDFAGQAGLRAGIDDAGPHGSRPPLPPPPPQQPHPPPTSLAADALHKPDAPYAGVNGGGGAHPPASCDIKPRLTKDQHDVLEAHYQKVPKPSTAVKKTFAEQLGVSLDKVNVRVCRCGFFLYFVIPAR